MATELIVIASSSATLPGIGRLPVLRLAGKPAPGEISPPNLIRHTEAAAQEIQRTFGDWLWRWVEATGALNLMTMHGQVSWWWLAPLSEKSSTRSPLIRELYWLALLRRVLEDEPASRVRWIGDEPLIAEVAARVVRSHGLECQIELQATRRLSGLPRWVASRLKWTVSQLLVWAILKLKPVGAVPDRIPRALLYTRFPILWEQTGQGWRERMYGEWPEYLRSRRESVGFAAVYSGSPWQLVRRRKEFREACASHGIQFLEAALSLGDVLRIHFSSRLWWRYWRWRRPLRARAVNYGDLDITGLFWREMDRSALSGELLFNEAIMAGLRRILRSQGSPQAVFHPFEYQPMERAVAAGVQSISGVPVVGLQTGMFTSNQLGFALTADELRRSASESNRAPAPDILAAYGELPYAVYLNRLGPERVCLSGAIRYPQLGLAAPFDAAAFRDQHQLPPDAEFIFVGTPAGRDEAMVVLAAAFTFAAGAPGTFLLLKFHYHCLLHDEVARLAQEHDVSRFRIFAGDLYNLLRLAPVFVAGGSSICIEALALGTMPVVYVAPGEMAFNPVLEVPEAVFLWYTTSELTAALQSCLARDSRYEARRQAWPQAVAAQLYRLDGRANERLYEFLRARRVFKAANLTLGPSHGD